MAKSLVVVESPAKAKTIGKYLGAGYDVHASKGHVRDLPKTGLGVDVDNDFKPEYIVSKDRSSVMKELKAAAGKADQIFLATDLDREGEAIAWHIVEALKAAKVKIDPARTHRVVFNEITASAIREAFAHPGQLDLKKVDAQQARRILDRLVGYKISPLLWRKVRPKLSAGRVQSVAVRLIVEREREIEAFVKEEYWRIRASLTPLGVKDEKQQFVADLVTWQGKKFRPAQGDAAEAVASALRVAAYTILEKKVKRTFDKAPPPFITSEMQRSASTQLRMSSDRTMRVAQQLYEGVELGKSGPVALITYMRTDSHHVAASAVQACRQLIGERFGPQYLPEKPHYFSSAKSAQEAHEAIRPTDVNLTPEEVASHLTEDQARLYGLIWKRFIGSQMKPAEWEVTDLLIDAGPPVADPAAAGPANRGQFKAIGRTLIYDGHSKLTGLRVAEGEQIIPAVEARQKLDLVELKPSQHFTQPPPRYSEATLIKKLESLGIGRPSTYASILSTIEEREYVEQLQRRYHATELGKIVTDKLVESFPNILNVDFTRHMEEDLDKVESGDMNYVTVLREFYGPFSLAVDAAMKPVELKTEIACDLCGKKMVVRASRRGPFLSCEGYPKCKNAKEVPPEILEQFKTELDAQPSMKKVMPKETGRLCPDCGAQLVERLGRFGLFVGCEKYPKCKFIEKTKKKPPTGEVTELPCGKCTQPLSRIKSTKGVIFYSCSSEGGCGTMYPAKPETHELAELPVCTECGKPMVLRISRNEPFLGCSGYPKCKTAVSLGPKGGGKGRGRRGASAGGSKKKLLVTDVQCEKCGNMMVMRAGRRGPFLACPGYPKCKNAKDPSSEWVERFNEHQAALEAAAAAKAGADENEPATDDKDKDA